MCESIVPFFQPIPLLAAPTVRLTLSAPRIAGLLPASTHESSQQAAKPYFVFDRRPSREEILRQLGPIRSFEEMMAENAAILARRRSRSERTVSHV